MVNPTSVEWLVYVHERDHLVHNSLYNFGGAQSYTTLIDESTAIIVVHEINRKEVTYLSDPRTPCQSKPREEDMNTCIQNHIENKMRCQLPWHAEKTTLPKCTESGQYGDFLGSYEEIASLDEFAIARMTCCLPSCKISEFTLNIINRIAVNVSEGEVKYNGYFYYPGSRYTQKVYHYTYDFTSYIADAGGLVGLFLGYSMLSIYDMIKNTWKKRGKY